MAPYPQIKGQSEKDDLNIEKGLKEHALQTCKGIAHLPLVEFTYNSNHQADNTSDAL